MNESRRISRRRLTLIGGGLGVAALATAGAGVAVLPHGSEPSPAATVLSSHRSTPTATAVPETPAEFTTLDFSTASEAVQQQMAYLLSYWHTPNENVYGFIDEFDCMNFASQALLARGWTTDDIWWPEPTGDAVNSSMAWISSTAFMEYLSEHPELATPLADASRSQLAVGDIVQFDWDNSGDRDHTGIVTRIDTDASGKVTAYYAGHTDNTLVRSVDWAITVLHPGATATYWHLN